MKQRLDKSRKLAPYPPPPERPDLQRSVDSLRPAKPRRPMEDLPMPTIGDPQEDRLQERESALDERERALRIRERAILEKERELSEESMLLAARERKLLAAEQDRAEAPHPPAIKENARVFTAEPVKASTEQQAVIEELEERVSALEALLRQQDKQIAQFTKELGDRNLDGKSSVVSL